MTTSKRWKFANLWLWPPCGVGLPTPTFELKPVNTMIRLENISKSFGASLVLDGVSLDVEAGEVVALIGASGSGKTTLLRCVNALELPDKGSVYVDGKPMGIYVPGLPPAPLAEHELDLRRAEVGMVFQRFNLFPHLTAAENVMLGPRRVRGLSLSEAGKVARLQLGRVALSEKYDAYPEALSGGQQQRVAIARALAMAPKLMLFDEPTSALDPELVGEVLAIMRQLAAEGMTMLIVTHEMQFAQETASRVLYLDSGRILEDGSPQSLFGSPKHERTRSFLKRILHKEATL